MNYENEEFQEKNNCENDPPTERLTCIVEKNDLGALAYYCVTIHRTDTGCVDNFPYTSNWHHNSYQPIQRQRSQRARRSEDEMSRRKKETRTPQGLNRSKGRKD